jgi:hypothetical protein
MTRRRRKKRGERYQLAKKPLLFRDSECDLVECDSREYKELTLPGRIKWLFQRIFGSGSVLIERLNLPKTRFCGNLEELHRDTPVNPIYA